MNPQLENRVVLPISLDPPSVNALENGELPNWFPFRRIGSSLEKDFMWVVQFAVETEIFGGVCRIGSHLKITLLTLKELM